MRTSVLIFFSRQAHFVTQGLTTPANAYLTTRIINITYAKLRVINTYYNEAYRASRPEGRKGICDIYGEDF